MNRNRLVLTIIVIFILSTFMGLFIHGMWLKQDYLPVADLYRPDDQVKMPFIILAYLAFAVGWVWLYAHGVENKPWLGQGVRFGITMWLVLSVSIFFIDYAVQPIPAILMAKQVISEGVNKIFLGIVTALLYRR